MSDHLRYDGRVAVITGAGNGLGRCHALLLGSRGAKVVVNDLGGGAHGGGKSSAAADRVVEEIRALGGEAVANYDSVEDGDKIVQTAMDHFGRIDILINNAGILRDASFAKMTDEDWDLIYRVHLRGSYKVTHAAWPYMREAEYGRIIVTTSGAGIYGNFGQANYSTVKLGLLGLANTLAIEGRSKNIHVNSIAPVAGSRLTETVMPPDLLAALKPEFISPLVGWLVHEDCEETSGLFEIGAGFMAKLRWERTLGHNFRGRNFTPEDVSAKWAKITDFTGANHPKDVNESFGPILGDVGKVSKGGNEFIDADEATEAEPIVTTNSYTEHDISLYALGIGAARDPFDDSERALVYELNDGGFFTLPTYGVMPASNAFMKLAQEGHTFPGCNFGFDRILHGEQYTEVKRPLPPHATLTHKTRVKDVFDKGKNAIVTFATETFDETGDLLTYNEMTAVVRGAGGWGGDRGPSVEVNVPPDRAPDAVIEETTDPNQTLLYRLSGDWNPLHADPAFAKAFGFEKPILHGLCFFGYAGRHVVKAFCKNDPRYFKSIKVRFADSVYPGETLVTEMWRENDTRVILRMKVKERDKVVLSNAAVELYAEIPKPKAKPVATAAAAAAPVSNEPLPADVFAVIAEYVAAHPDLPGKVGTVYQWVVTDPDERWILDLKNGTGSCTPGTVDKADCTLQLSAADLTALCTGKADAQKLYFGGKLKVTGNIMASQKLEFLRALDPKLILDKAAARGASGAGAAPAPAAPSGPSTADVFAALAAYIEKTPGIAGKVGTVYQWKVTDPESNWILDLKNGDGSCKPGVADKADCTITVAEPDLIALCTGKADAQKLYFGGKLKIAGNIMASQKLEFLKNVEVKAGVAGPAATAAATPPATAIGPSRSGPVFEALAGRLKTDQVLKSSLGAVIQVEVREPAKSWVIDGIAGAVTEGQADNPASVVTIEDADLMSLAEGAVEARELFQKGKLRVDGDVMVAHKLDALMRLS